MPICSREGVLTNFGALTAFTGSRTGRSPKDKFTVKEAGVADQIDWTANQPMEPAVFHASRDRVKAYLAGANCTSSIASPAPIRVTDCRRES